MRWIPGNTPDIPEGANTLFVVERTLPDGRSFTFPLRYLNRHRMPLANDCLVVPDCAEPVDEDGDEYYWTGWFSEQCDICEHMNLWDHPEEITAYLPIPPAP